jgi:hypothetical protein
MKIIAATALLLAAPGIALAQADQWEAEVHAQLDGIVPALAGDGWELDRDYYVDSLNQDSSDNLDLPLFGRTNYAIVAVCDTDCTDIDLYLYDANDNIIAEDTATDDYPVLEVRTRATADYRLRVRMYQCSAAPCRYGVAVFTQ